MLYCELCELYPISDNVIRCQDCPEFSFCPVIEGDFFEEGVIDD